MAEILEQRRIEAELLAEQLEEEEEEAASVEVSVEFQE